MDVASFSRQETIEKLRTLASVRGESMLETVSDPEVADGLSAKSREAVKQMTQVIDLCRRERENLRISDIYDSLLIKTGYMKALEDEKSARRGKFSFSNRGGAYTIDYNDIIFLESKGHSLVIHTGSGVCHEMNGKLDDIETGFPDNFIRCHKSYLVNMDWPDRIDKKQHKFVIDSGKRPNAEDKECIVPISKFRYKGTRDKYLKYLTLKG